MAHVTLTLRHTDQPGFKSAEFSNGTRSHTIPEVPVSAVAQSIPVLAQAGFTSEVTEDNAFVLTSPEVSDEAAAEVFDGLELILSLFGEPGAPGGTIAA